MATLYLHIGMPKTGTSAIQSFLKINNRVLNEKGYIYPDFNVRYENIGKYRNAHFLIGHLYDETDNRDTSAEKELFKRNFDIISKLSQTYPNIILSDESIWNSAEKHTDKDFWKRLKAETDKRGIELKVIVYLRRQDMFMQSFWAQQVKKYSTLSFPAFLKKRTKNIKLDYYARLNQIAEHMGKESIIVRVYEKQQFEGTDGTLISDFLKTVGLELTEEYAPLDKLVNTSLSGIYLETKRHMNKYPEFRVKNNYFSADLKTVQENNEGVVDFKKTKYLKYSEQIEFLNRFEESNKKVAEEYLNRKDGVLFRDEIPEYDDVQSEEYSVDEYLAVVKQVFQLRLEEKDNKIAELNNVIKGQESTIKWMSASLPAKFSRKLKRIFNKS